MDTRVTITGLLGDKIEKFKDNKYPHLTSKGFFIEMARLQMEKDEKKESNSDN